MHPKIHLELIDSSIYLYKSIWIFSPRLGIIFKTRRFPAQRFSRRFRVHLTEIVLSVTQVQGTQFALVI